MQTRKAVGPALAALDLTPKESDRFAYQNRFVPIILRDSNGVPIPSIVTQTIVKRAIQRQDSAPVPASGAGSGGGHLSHLVGSSFLADAPVHRDDGLTAVSMPVITRPEDDINMARTPSDFGVILLERTRIRPDGFALGEHLLSLSLAPGEEVTIEQKSFSERTVTLEEAVENEEEINTELVSTFTTELSGALSKTKSDTRNSGLDIGGSIGGDIKGVKLNVNASYRESIAEALTTTESETVRNVMTSSEKLASRRRAQHKITMKISETSRFETGSKRVIRNPNQFTPIDLVYFKILQKLKISHERYGVRLAWAPFIPDPGVVLSEAEIAERERLEKAIPLDKSGLTLRDEPQKPNGRLPEEVTLIQLPLEKWGKTWGDMYAFYAFDIFSTQAGFVWDGDVDHLNDKLHRTALNFGARKYWSVYVTNAEHITDASTGKNGVKIYVATSIPWGGPNAQLSINLTARFVDNFAAADAAFMAAHKKWEAEKVDYETKLTQLKAERDQVIQAALATWRESYMKTFDPVYTTFQKLVASLFAANEYDEGFEVEMWTKIFDFDSAAFQYYPAWWTNRPLRNPEKPPDSFENASWMRVYLPIKPGSERLALNLLVERRISFRPSFPGLFSPIDEVLGELDTLRSTYFGGPREVTISGRPSGTTAATCPDASRPYICLAKWDELLPTDGTHLEVIQAMTTAIDDTSQQSITDAHNMVNARIGSQQVEADLTKAVNSSVSSSGNPPDVDVHIGIGTKRED